MKLTFGSKPHRDKGIRSDAERERAAIQVSFFRAAMEKVRAKKTTRRNEEFTVKCEKLLHEREAEIREYDDLKGGKLKLPRIQRFSEAAKLIPRIRIARGFSQTELARHLGVSKQVVSRYEESDYQTVGLARLQEIMDVLGAKIQIDFTDRE